MDLIEKAEKSASECEEQGFHATANAMRELAEEMRLLSQQGGPLEAALTQRKDTKKPRF